MGLIKTIKEKLQGKIPSGSKRSSEWPRVRREFLKDHPRCAVCNGTKKTEIHHKEVFHLHPELELDPANLIPLCEAKKYGVTCHLFFGHAGSYKGYNPDVEKDAMMWNMKLKENQKRIKG